MPETPCVCEQCPNKPKSADGVEKATTESPEDLLTELPVDITSATPADPPHEAPGDKPQNDSDDESPSVSSHAPHKPTKKPVISGPNGFNGK